MRRTSAPLAFVAMMAASMPKTARIYVIAPPELKEALADAAKRMDRSQNWIINAALAEYLKRTQPLEQP